MSMVIWIVVIACITAVTMTSIICSAKIEESKYETFARTMNNPWINNETTTNELKKMVEKLMAATSKTKGE